MTSSGNIFFERAEWKRPLRWSAAFHATVFAAIFLYAFIVGSQRGNNWGEGGQGSAMGATLVSSAIPLPANPVETQNVLATQSKGLSYTQPKAVEETPEAIAIPERKAKPATHTARQTVKPPPEPVDNTVPYGEGGPVSQHYTMFTTQNMQGGLSVGENGNFGTLYGWYVDVVRRKISENWMKYEVDPNITAAQRVYLTFDILRDGSPTNIQIEESSGVPSLDQSAVRALERIDSFGPLPGGYNGSKVSVEFWFDYQK